MVALYTRVRTALALTASGAALITALGVHSTQSVMATSRPPRSPVTNELLRAKLTSTQVLAGEQDLAVMIQMPTFPDHDGELSRAVSVVVVLDRSASMHGDPLANAKRAATSLIEQLDDGDSFAVVTFSDRDELVVAAGKASPDRKHAASEAIERIVASGGTCASCGILRGEHEILQSPDLRGIRRMVFISDGQANLGIRIQDELVELAGRTAEHGVSISTVGVGLDFDEETLIRIGETAHGNYYFAKDTGQLDAVFATELTGLRRITATHVSLLALQEDGNPIERAYGYPLQTIKRGVVVPIADLGADEARKVVLHGLVTTPEVGSYQLTWIDPADGTVHSARTTLATTITKDPARVAATRDAEATAAVEQARIARAIDQSVTVYEHAGAAAAKATIQHFLRDAHISDRAARRGADAATASYDLAAPEAKKSVRALAYDLARAPTD
jgi:Ca-activated chloride channel family protein